MELDELTKELVAVGASVAANCHPCVQYHVKKAREVGAGGQQIKDAIGVGKVVRKGAASKMDQLVSTLTALPGDGAAGGLEDDGGCGA